MKKLALYKLHSFLAVIIVASVALASAYVVTGYSRFVYAINPIGYQVGLLVLSQPVTCVLDSAAGDCLATCQICGALPTCSGVHEIKVEVLSGNDLFLQSGALCLAQGVPPVPPRGGSFQPGAQCLGQLVQDSKGHDSFFQNNFGCSGGNNLLTI